MRQLPAVIALGLLAAFLARAQSTLTITGPPTAQAGATINLTVGIAGSLGSAADEFVVSSGTPGDVTAMSATIAAAATAAMKTLNCAPPGTTMSLHCIIYGAANATVIGGGAIATVAVTLAASVTPKAEVFTLAQPEISADPAGGALTVTVGAPASVAIASPCDVTGDGIVNGVDTLAIVNWALGVSAPGPGQHCDMNGDGKCDVRDVEIVAAAASGLPCTGH